MMSPLATALRLVPFGVVGKCMSWSLREDLLTLSFATPRSIYHVIGRLASAKVLGQDAGDRWIARLAHRGHTGSVAQAAWEFLVGEW